MSSNEKRLLTFFGIGAFVVVNLILVSKFLEMRQSQAGAEKAAKQEYEMAQLAVAQQDQIKPEMEWLAKHEPAAKDAQIVESDLQEFVQAQAVTQGLTVKLPKIEDADTTGVNFHRARFNVSVTGPEKALYSWIDKLQTPSEFRAVTNLRLEPNKENDALIDAKLTVEQWFVPNR